MRVIIQVALKTTACNIKRWMRVVLCGSPDAVDAAPCASWWLVIVDVIDVAPKAAVVIAA